MMKITIVTIGKLKEKYFQAAASEYLKRLRPYVKLEMVELSVEPFGKSNKAAAKRIEAERIINFLDKHVGAHVFLLDEGGRELTSEQLAKELDKIQTEIIFVIGGALGFDPHLFSKYKMISLSKLTFLHEMAKVILLEQLYRANAILRGKDYHY
jgi:23S rRNA (pseudouridine1915-N3)-methyltransferase